MMHWPCILVYNLLRDGDDYGQPKKYEQKNQKSLREKWQLLTSVAMQLHTAGYSIFFFQKENRFTRYKYEWFIEYLLSYMSAAIMLNKRKSTYFGRKRIAPNTAPP